jgi:carboxylate-amine ligase
MLEENLWRAIRFGLDGKLIDLDRGEEYPAAAIVDRLLAWTAPARSELGLEPQLPERNTSQVLREQEGDLRSIFAATLDRTAATYGTAAPTF